MVRLTGTFYLNMIGHDCGAHMLISMVILSNRFEANAYESKNYSVTHCVSSRRILTKKII